MRNRTKAPEDLWRAFRETMTRTIASITARLKGDVEAAAKANGIRITVDQAAQIDAAYEVYVTGYREALAAELERTTRDGLAAIEASFKAGDIDVDAAAERAAKLFSPERAQSIAITEVSRLYNDVSTIVYQITGQVDRVEFLTVADPFVDEECAALDGEIFILGEEPEIPLHVNCRCRYAPVVREEAA